METNSLCYTVAMSHGVTDYRLALVYVVHSPETRVASNLASPSISKLMDWAKHERECHRMLNAVLRSKLWRVEIHDLTKLVAMCYGLSPLELLERGLERLELLDAEERQST